jgi:hypothetical protein
LFLPSIQNENEKGVSDASAFRVAFLVYQSSPNKLFSSFYWDDETTSQSLLVNQGFQQLF